MRAKILYLPQHELIHWLRGGANLPKQFVACKLDILEDAQVYQVSYAPERMAYCVAVTHPSYDDIPAGARIPVLEQPITLQKHLLQVVDMSYAFDMVCITTERLKLLRDAINTELYDRERR